MSDAIVTTALLAVATFATRFLGVVVGVHLPAGGRWKRALDALPGSLIVSLLAATLANSGPDERIGAAVALGVAFAVRSLPLTMLVGMVTVWLIRSCC